MQRAMGLLTRASINVSLQRGRRYLTKSLPIKDRFPDIYPLPPVKTDYAHLRYYLPLNPYEKLGLNRKIIQELKPIPWSQRIDLIDEPLSISTMYMEGVTRTRNTGNLFLLTRRDPNTQERVRHLLKRYDRANPGSVSRELVSYPIGKLLGQGQHFLPIQLLPDQTLGSYWVCRRYVEGVPADMILDNPQAFSYLSDKTMARLFFLNKFMGLTDCFPDNYVQVLNQILDLGPESVRELTNIQDPKPSHLTDQLKIIDTEQSFSTKRDEFGSYLFTKDQRDQQPNPDRLPYIFLYHTKDAMLMFLKIKHFQDCKDKGIEITPEVAEKIYDTILSTQIDTILVENAINRIDDMNELLLFYRVYSEKDLETKQNHQLWSEGLKRFSEEFGSDKLTIRHLLSGEL